MKFCFLWLQCERWQQLLRRCFETLFVDPCLFIAIQLCWNFKPYCFNFFPKSALLNWGCSLPTDAAYTWTVTVIVHNSPSPQYSRERSAGMESERSACRIPKGSNCALLWPRICNENFNSWDMLRGHCYCEEVAVVQRLNRVHTLWRF